MTRTKITFLAAAFVFGCAGCADSASEDGASDDGAGDAGADDSSGSDNGSSTPDGGNDDPTQPSTEQTDDSAGSATEITCETLDESEVSAIVGEGSTVGPTISGATVNDVQFESRGCVYDFGENGIEWQVRLSPDTEVFDQLVAAIDDGQQLEIGGQPGLLDAGPFDTNLYIQVDQGMVIVEAEPDGDAEVPPDDPVLQLGELAVEALG